MRIDASCSCYICFAFSNQRKRPCQAVEDNLMTIFPTKINEHADWMGLLYSPAPCSFRKVRRPIGKQHRFTTFVKSIVIGPPPQPQVQVLQLLGGETGFNMATCDVFISCIKKQPFLFWEQLLFLQVIVFVTTRKRA